MELNGIANIKALVDVAVNENTECHTTIEVELADKILKQLNYLERYMLAYKEVRDEYTSCAYIDSEVPKWHEVTANPEKFPNNNGK